MGNGEAKVTGNDKNVPETFVSGSKLPEVAAAPLAEDYNQYIECTLNALKSNMEQLEERLQRQMKQLEKVKETTGAEPDYDALIEVHKYKRMCNDMDVYNGVIHCVGDIKQHIIMVENLDELSGNDDFILKLCTLQYAKEFVNEGTLESICQESVELFGGNVSKARVQPDFQSLCGTKFTEEELREYYNVIKINIIE